MQVTIHRLAELTGIHRETIRKRCSELIPEGQRSPNIESTKALPLIYGANSDFDYEAENARLTHHKANIAALDEDVKRKSLLPADIVQSHWESMVANMRAKLLNLPGRLAGSVMGHDTTQAAERAAMEIIREALDEISGDGIP